MKAREIRYHAAFLTKYISRGSMFCTECVELRPVTNFPASQVIRGRSSAEKSGQCIRHARFWTCSHRDSKYPGDQPKAFGLLVPWYSHGTCNIDACDLIFRHSVTPYLRPVDTLEISTLLATFPHYGGVESLRQPVSRRLSPEAVKDLLWNGLGPVCDHHTLSHPKILGCFDINDIDIEDRIWATFGRSSQLTQNRTPRLSDGACDYCAIMDVHTSWHFVLRIQGQVSAWEDEEHVET